MAISGLQVINIGVQNESIGSDSLYTAFNKTKTNFATLFANSSPYNTYTGNTGISVSSNSTAGTVDITNTGVVSLTAGTGISLSGGNGNVTISSTGGGGGGAGTVTSVGISPASTSRITVSGSPIVSSGTITLDLATTGVTAGTYTYPTVTVDNYGRVTSISNASSVGTVTSVGITPGFGIQVTGSPVTTSGTMTILNTGVTRLSAGTGISLSGSNGNVTISTATGAGTVTSVGVTSSSLDVSGSPIVAAGTISVELKSNTSITGDFTAGNVYANSGTIGGSLVAGTLTTAAQPNVTSVGTLTSLGVTGSVTAGGLRGNSTTGVGYTTGAGGTVTQTTSRTTGVTINKTTGAITLVSAAGTSSYTTFTVTNSTVAATDVIIVNQKSGTDKYETFVTNVSAGSFNITFSDVSGTTTEQPVFNFAVIKGVTS